jgi:hypothetical protein
MQEIERAAIRLYKAQFCALYRIAEEATRYRQALEHWYWRPVQPPLRNPLAWFRYAARCVRSQVHHRRSGGRYGERYTFLYTRMLLAQNWEPKDQAEMVAIEKHLNAESVAKFRQAAKQMAQVQTAAAEAAKKETRSRQSWGQWAKSFVASTVDETVDISDLDVESQKILREAVLLAESPDDEMEVNAYPREYARYRVDFHAVFGSLTLVEEGWLPGSDAQELCYMQFNDLDGQYRIRQTSYQYSFELMSIIVDDRKNAIQGLSQIASCRSGNTSQDIRPGAAEATKLLKWNFDTLPSSECQKDGGEMSVVVDGLNLVYSVESVLGIYNFWYVPKNDRFLRQNAPIVENRVILEEELGQEVSLWLDRTQYDKRMKWKLSVLQPCILFPANPKDGTEPIIVFDVDRFFWGSEFPNENSDKNSIFYDRSVMSIENTRFRMVDDVETWLRCLVNRRVAWMMKPITLATDFDFNFAWDRCKLPHEICVAKDLPRNVLSGALPQVHFLVEGHQYCTFWYTFFKVMKSHWGTPEELAIQASTPQLPVPGSGRSFAFKFNIHELKLDLLKSTTHQHLTLQAEAEDRDGAEDEKTAFATMIFSGFQVSYENGNISKLDLHMESLKIQDLIQNCLFASSDTDVGGVSKGSFVSIQRGWAVPGAINHPGVDTWWVFDFRTLGLNWNDQTVALLMQFCAAAFATHSKALEAAAVSAASELNLAPTASTTKEALEHDATAMAAVGSSAPPPVVKKSRITASFQLLSATLMRDGVSLARMAMSAASCTYDSHLTGKLSGKLGDFVVEDLRGDNLYFREKLGLRDKSRSVIEFDFQTYDTAAKDFPGYEYFLSLQMSSTRLVYVKDFIEDLRIYITEEPLMSGIMGKTANAVAESAKKAAGHHRLGKGLTKVHTKLINPLVVVPIDDCGGAYVVADLGEITLKNHFEANDGKRLEFFQIEIEGQF